MAPPGADHRPGRDDPVPRLELPLLVPHRHYLGHPLPPSSGRQRRTDGVGALKVFHVGIEYEKVVVVD